MNNIQKYKADLENLVELGETMKWDMHSRDSNMDESLREKVENLVKSNQGGFEENYQRWYTESHVLIKQLLPDRLTEFESLYQGDGRRKNINAQTYNIQDWMNGTRAAESYSGAGRQFNDSVIVFMRHRTQLEILKAVQTRFTSSLFDIKQIVQADVFDSELDAARELARHGFLRASGAVAGVVLERHLGQVAENHNVKSRKKNPTIGDFNDLLKDGAVLDVPSWRQIQRLGDIRNLCTHNKQREPTRDEVEELVSGADKIVKTLF